QDPYDERFAWRMFSGVRLHRCDTRLTEIHQSTQSIVPLKREIHAAWIHHLRRNRSAVVHAVLESRCVHGAETAELENRCVSAAGTQLEPLRYRMDCSSGHVIREGSLP
ncbi:MAG: hypothetical protein AAF550_00645, partial [Myxococcota bacterium]